MKFLRKRDILKKKKIDNDEKIAKLLSLELFFLELFRSLFYFLFSVITPDRKRQNIKKVKKTDN